jgi:hypothetical protein
VHWAEVLHIKRQRLAQLLFRKPLQKALTESHFMDPLLAIACLFGGRALLSRRTAPLGIAILAPVVAVIFLFHRLALQKSIYCTLGLLRNSVVAQEARP